MDKVPLKGYRELGGDLLPYTQSWPTINSSIFKVMCRCGMGFAFL